MTYRVYHDFGRLERVINAPQRGVQVLNEAEVQMPLWTVLREVESRGAHEVQFRKRVVPCAENAAEGEVPEGRASPAARM